LKVKIDEEARIYMQLSKTSFEAMRPPLSRVEIFAACKCALQRVLFLYAVRALLCINDNHLCGRLKADVRMGWLRGEEGVRRW